MRRHSIIALRQKHVRSVYIGQKYECIKSMCVDAAEAGLIRVSVLQFKCVNH